MKNNRFKRSIGFYKSFAFAKAAFLLTILLVSCTDKKYQLQKVSGQSTAIDSSLNSVKEIEEFIEPYKKSVDAEMNKQLSYNPVAMHKNDYKLNTPISNMMAEIVREKGNPIFQKRSGESIDVVLLNHGGIRAPLDKGSVTMRSAYEIMPFENSIVVAQLNGSQMDSLVNYLVSRKRAHPMSGLQIQLDKNGDLDEVLINGETLDSQKLYYVATNDYLYNGGDNMSFFKNTPLTTLDYKIRNAMIDYFEETDTLRFTRDNRFTMAQ